MEGAKAHFSKIDLSVLFSIFPWVAGAPFHIFAYPDWFDIVNGAGAGCSCWGLSSKLNSHIGGSDLDFIFAASFGSTTEAFFCGQSATCGHGSARQWGDSNRPGPRVLFLLRKPSANSSTHPFWNPPHAFLPTLFCEADPVDKSETAEPKDCSEQEMRRC